MLLITPIFQYEDSIYPSKFSYKAYSELRNITNKDSLIFIDETNKNSIDPNLDGGLNYFSGISRRQFYLSGLFNTALRYKKEKLAKMIEKNSNLIKLEGDYCKLAREITSKEIFLITNNKRNNLKSRLNEQNLIYENKYYKISFK